MRETDSGELVLIDFGFSFTSTIQEDKAVDLYVLERSILSAYPDASIVVVFLETVVNLM